MFHFCFTLYIFNISYKMFKQNKIYFRNKNINSGIDLVYLILAIRWNCNTKNGNCDKMEYKEIL